jgi:5-methylcytosine-specific restriction protein A
MSRRPYSTQRWQKMRKQKLQREPLCEFCLRVGQLTPAVAVDHIIPIARGGDAYPPLDHLMSCCTPHHNAKTRAEQQGKPLTLKGIKGCDAFGDPLDLGHDWYKGFRK